MNILLINHYAGSSRHGMEYRPYYLARQWSRMGHQVAVVAASFSHLHVKRPDTKGPLTEEPIEGVRYFWLKTPSYHGNGVSRAINVLAFASRLRRCRGKLLRLFRPDAVIASSPHPMIIYGARAIAGKAAAKLVFEVRDLWPLTLVELGAMSPRHPFVLLMGMAERTAYRSADRVVSLLPKADVHMREHGMEPDKFAYVPNGVQASDWRVDPSAVPKEHAESLARLKDAGKFVVGYLGAHGPANALETLLSAAREVDAADHAFVLVGQGPEQQALREEAGRLGLRHVHFLPPVPRSAVPAVLDGFDALYIGLRKSPLFRFGVSPNKLMDYMMAAKPVISAIEAGNNPVAESGCGLSCDPDDTGAIAEAVRQLRALSAAERDELGRRGRQYVIENHEYEVLAGRLLDIMT